MFEIYFTEYLYKLLYAMSISPVSGIVVLLICSLISLLFRSSMLVEMLSISASSLIILNALCACFFHFRVVSAEAGSTLANSVFQFDLISILMVGLTGFVFLLCFIFEFKEKFFSLVWINTLLILELFIVIAFSTSNFFLFFMTFEFILCP